MQYYSLGDLNQHDFILFGDADKFWNLLERYFYIVPKDIIDRLRSDCAFLMMDRVRNAYFINKRSVIVFHDSLYSENEDTQADKILHEIAHYVLDHYDEGEDHKYDKEANDLKNQWIKDRQEHLKTQKGINS